MIAQLYRFVTAVIGLVLWPYGRLRAASGSELWRGRMGLAELPNACDLWLHASSVGEVRVLANLVPYLLARRPDTKIHVTTMTPAGQKTVASMLDGDVSMSFFPLDTRSIMRQTLTRLNPNYIAIAETEIWPNLIHEASDRSIPVILVNGRMSDKAHRSYRRFGAALGDLLGKYQRFFYKSHDDAKRYQSLGVAVDKGEVAGDMKFDTPLPDRSPALVRKWRDRIGVDENDFVFVAGSTRDGEERLLLDIFENLRAEYPRLRMVLAPRHVERAGSIVDMVKRRGLGVAIFGKDQAEITIVDRVGLLNDLYLAADLAFVGGTLVDIGGHNLLEPVWAGTPVLFGPSLDNVQDAAKYIAENDYGTMVDNAEDLRKQVEEVLTRHREFAIKNDSDLSNSATAIVGDYILKRLNHA